MHGLFNLEVFLYLNSPRLPSGAPVPSGQWQRRERPRHCGEHGAAPLRMRGSRQCSVRGPRIHGAGTGLQLWGRRKRQELCRQASSCKLVEDIIK